MLYTPLFPLYINWWKRCRQLTHFVVLHRKETQWSGIPLTWRRVNSIYTSLNKSRTLYIYTICFHYWTAIVKKYVTWKFLQVKNKLICTRGISILWCSFASEWGARAQEETLLLFENEEVKFLSFFFLLPTIVNCRNIDSYGCPGTFLLLLTS